VIEIELREARKLERKEIIRKKLEKKFGDKFYENIRKKISGKKILTLNKTIYVDAYGVDNILPIKEIIEDINLKEEIKTRSDGITDVQIVVYYKTSLLLDLVDDILPGLKSRVSNRM